MKVILILSLIFASCNLFNAPTDSNYWEKIEDEIAYANAPWVPVFIQTGGMGIADPAGPQPRLVKKGYSFSIYFQPSRDYPFIGWQAWIEGEGIIAHWIRPENEGSEAEELGEERVNFVPVNNDGTEAVIYVYDLPSAGRQLFIGPLGADTSGINVIVETGGLGTAFPVGELQGIKQGYPFNINFQPSAEYDFKGWQAFIGSGPRSLWKSGLEPPEEQAIDNYILWEPQNIFGTEMTVTIKNLPENFSSSDRIIIMPIGGEGDSITILVSVPGSWGTVFPLAAFRKLGFPLTVSFSPSGVYEFRGWKVKYKDTELSRWDVSTKKAFGDGIEWSVRNASGTEIDVTILSLPSDFNYETDTITVIPLDSDYEEKPLRVELGDVSWGSFSPVGLQARMQTFPLEIEFTPSAAFAFVEWRAYLVSAGGTLLDETMVKFGDPKQEKTDVTIEAAMASSETIVLVPYCELRPRVDHSTPPLNTMLNPFPYDQPIYLSFNTPIEQDSVVGNISISAVHASDENKFEKKRGESFGGPDINSYFRMEFPSLNRINLIPVNSTERPSVELAFLSITVVIGPGIKSVNGAPMGITQDILYETNISEVQKVYRPGLISASRTQSSGYFNDAIPWNRPDIDRRFNRGHKEEDKNFDTVYIRFSVTPPEDAPSPTPNRITVVEQREYTLDGSKIMNSKDLKTEYATDDSRVSYNQGTGEYTITHSLKTAESCIIRLAVLPWYDDQDTPVPPLSPGDAFSMGQYVRVVMELAPPELDPLNARLNEPSSVEPIDDPDSNIFIYGSGTSIILTLDGLANIIDNGIGIWKGRPAATAYNLPWTMDDAYNLYWHIQIGNDNDAEKITSERLNVYTETSLTNTWSTKDKDITKLTKDAGYPVMVKFEDRMGNISPAWIPTGFMVKYSAADINSVSDLKAVVNSAGNNITVTWDEPGEYLYPELIVNRYRSTPAGLEPEGEIFRNNFGEQRSAGGSFSVPLITTNRVREGEEVSGVYGYEIMVTAHNVAGQADTGPLWVFNIPDMNVTETNTALVNSQKSLTKAFADTDITNVVLTRNIIVDNWKPVGNQENPWTGKLYGNGHSIAITSFVGDISTYSDIGFFGMVRDATIRDITIAYVDPAEIIDPEIIPSSTTQDAPVMTSVGGLIGRARGDTLILNSIVRGVNSSDSTSLTDENLDSELTVSMSRTTAFSISLHIRIGGIAGYLEGGTHGGDRSLIQNCRAALSVAYTSTGHTGRTYIGGIAGEIGHGGNGSITFLSSLSSIPVSLNNGLVNGVTISANVSTNMGGYSGIQVIGGAVGKSGGGLTPIREHTLYDIEFAKGRVSFFGTHSNSSNFVGGIVGELDSTNIINTSFKGEIGTINNLPINCGVQLGGVIGISLNSNGNFIHNITTRGNIFLSSNQGFTIGGVIGQATGNVVITDSILEDGTITVNSSGTQGGSTLATVGGFIGNFGLGGQPIINNCGTLAGTINVITNFTSPRVGGFTSEIRGDISNCFSRINIITESEGGGASNLDLVNVNVGGFVGWLHTGSISNCYATGSVRSSLNNGIAFNATIGGLVGSSRDNITTSISNSYALGDVLLNHRNGSAYYVNAGGLVGLDGGSIINNCFSTGQVSMQSNASLLTHPALPMPAPNFSAGGIVGYKVAGSISNSAALGAKVTAGAPVVANRGAQRIRGAGAGTLTNNHAIDSMQVGTGTYNAGTTNFLTATVAQIMALIPGSTVVSTDANSINGRDTPVSWFTNSFWWQDTLRFNLNGSGIGNVSNVWDFSGIQGRGYPLLRGVAGQE